MIICLKPRQLTVDNYQQACGHTPISIVERMILFGYVDNQSLLLGNGEPWGSSFQGPGFPVGLLFPQILGIQLKVHSLAQDGVLLSRQSLFCFLQQFLLNYYQNLKLVYMFIFFLSFFFFLSVSLLQNINYLSASTHY